MLGLPNLPDMWRVLKEADLSKIRREAERPFQMLLVAENVGDAERLGVLLSRPEATRHPWLLPADPADVRRAAGSGMLDVAIALSPTPAPSPALALAVDALRDARVPIVMIVLGSRGSSAAVAWPGEAARAVVAALDPSAVTAVAQALLAAVSPGMRLALARHLVPLREPLFAELIEETARTNAMYALTTGLAEVVPVLDVPLNVADIVVLTKNQLVMSYRIALACGLEGDPRRLMPEILGVLGGGLLFRQVARQLIGLVPVIGIVPKVAVAYGGTWAIGRAVTLWATGGGRMTGERLRQLSREGLRRGEAVARDMGRLNP
jgi:uncharacterized protein (DUF697 family)